MQRVIAVLEEYFVTASTGRRVVDLNLAAGIALFEIQRLKSIIAEEDGQAGNGLTTFGGQEAGRDVSPATEPI